MSDVSNAALADVCSVLEFVVLERLDGGFVRMGDYPLPPWFVRVFIQAQNEGVTLTSVFPVLDSFLSEADQFWTSIGDGRLSSEAFMASDSLGEELAIVATAVGARGRRFLLMQPDASFPERQRVLQIAREQALEQERLVKQIQELRKPIASLAALAADLPAAPVADAHRVQIEAIATHVSTLQRILGELPQAPRGASLKPR
jgi:hypothetical protein